MAITEYRVGETMSDEDSLAHYGVKGMKWGVRKAATAFSPTKGVGAKAGMKIGQAYVKRQTTPDASGVTRREAKQTVRKQNRDLDRKLQDFETSSSRSNLIREARKNNVAAMRKYEDVRDEIKAGKGSGAIGKNQARILLNQARNERYESIYKSDSKTAGEQFIDALFAPSFDR